MRRTTLLRTAAVATSAALAAASALPATATHAPAPKPVAITVLKHLTTPLSLAVAAHGTVMVTENFAATLVVGGGLGKTTRFPFGKKAELGGVSIDRGDVYLAYTPAQGEARVFSYDLKSRKTKTVGNVGKYEAQHNPDSATTYGFRDIDEECEAEFTDAPAAYPGGIDSHPYATATSKGTTYVADAGGNSILAARKGQVGTVASLPAVPVEITEAAAAANGMPDCVVGLTYWLEAVPTDVEVGKGGLLYVSSLPGGPEDGSLGALGSVFVINPRTGMVDQVVDGFAGATGLAVAGNGDIYVAELYAGRISKIRHGTSKATLFVKVKAPAAVELSKGRLFATVNALSGAGGGPAQGRVVAYEL